METARCPSELCPLRKPPRRRTQALVTCVRRRRDFSVPKVEVSRRLRLGCACPRLVDGVPALPVLTSGPGSRSLSLLPLQNVTVACTPAPRSASSRPRLGPARRAPANGRTPPRDLAAAAGSPRSTSRWKLRCYSRTRVITSVPFVESPRPSLILGSKSKLLNVDFEAVPLPPQGSLSPATAPVRPGRRRCFKGAGRSLVFEPPHI